MRQKNLQSSATRQLSAALWPAIVACSLLAALVVTGCSSQASTPAKQPYPELYQQLSESYANDGEITPPVIEDKDVIDERFAKFKQLYADIHDPQLEQLIEEVYADTLYFNDTLHTHTERRTLIDYLLETQEKVDFNRVQIHDITPTGDGYYVRWSMDTGFTIFNKQVKTHSIGITHVRFDQQGKVNFHQDFWDNTEGFFRHVPVVGYFIGKTKQRL